MEHARRVSMQERAPPQSTAAERARRVASYALGNGAGDNLNGDGDDLDLVTANEADLACEYGARHTPRLITSTAPSTTPLPVHGTDDFSIVRASDERVGWMRHGPRWIRLVPPDL